MLIILTKWVNYVELGYLEQSKVLGDIKEARAVSISIGLGRY